MIAHDVRSFHPGQVLAALNGLGFYAQLQLSFVCLSRMSALSHSLANSMRRPVTIVAALAFAPAMLTRANWAGVVLACLGALVYGLVWIGLDCTRGHIMWPISCLVRSARWPVDRGMLLCKL